MTSVAITFKPLYGVRSEDPLCYVLEIDEVGVLQQLATCSYAVYLTQTVCCCSYYYHHIAFCVCFPCDLMQVRFLLDCGWDERLDESLLEPLREYDGSHEFSVWLPNITCRRHRRPLSLLFVQDCAYPRRRYSLTLRPSTCWCTSLCCGQGKQCDRCST